MDQLINYGQHAFPVSRPPDDIIQKLEKGHCQSTYQLSLLVCNLGNLCRPMQFGDKKAKRYVGPSMVCKFLMHNWAHIRVVLEADKILECPEIKNEMYAHYITGIHGTKIHTKPSMSQVQEERQE